MPDESILGTSQGFLRIESPAKLVATAAGGEVATSAKDGDDEAPAAKAARKEDGDTAGSKKSTGVAAVPKAKAEHMYIYIYIYIYIYNPRL